MKSEDNVSLYYIRHSVWYGYWLSNVITYAVMIDRGEGRLDGNSLRLSKEIMHRVICLPSLKRYTYGTWYKYFESVLFCQFQHVVKTFDVDTHG